jgi:hypothetical protein
MATPSRIVTLYTNQTGLVEIKSQAKTFGELVDEINDTDVPFNTETQKAVIANGPHKDHTLEMMSAELPTGSFVLTIVQKEGKAGLETIDTPNTGIPNERNTLLRTIKDFIKEAKGDEAKEHFNAGKKYHLLKLKEIRSLIESWNTNVQQLEEGLTAATDEDGTSVMNPTEGFVKTHINRIVSQLSDVTAGKNL